jgi:hypothetical protein
VFQRLLYRFEDQIHATGNANLQIGGLKDAIRENGVPGEFRTLAELILSGDERNTDFHDGSLFEVKRLSGNQNAIAIARPDFARRGD